MTTKRSLILLIVLGLGLSAVFVLPKSLGNQPIGVRMELPQYLGRWYGVDAPITDRELTALASDTEFARKTYTDGAGNTMFVSIVLSGHDLDNSIHRPERCLPAQGWTILDSRRLQIPLNSTDGGKLEVTRLRDVQRVPTRDGKSAERYNLDYYWFVGYNRTTASHLRRTGMDIYDRVVKGYTQRWAYVTIASDITKGFVPFGLSEADTDKMIQEFIKQLYPTISPTSPEIKSAGNDEHAGRAM
jgi:EpsI family protein